MEEKSLHAEEPEAERNLPFQTRDDLSKLSVNQSFKDFDSARLSKKEGLSAEEKLKSRKIIDKLFEEGKSVTYNGFTLVHLIVPLPSFYPVQVAFSVPKKNFKHAVDRNRIKRLMREVYRKSKLSLYGRLKEKNLQMACMFVFKGKAMPDFATTEKSVDSCLKKISQS